MDEMERCVLCEDKFDVMKMIKTHYSDYNPKWICERCAKRLFEDYDYISELREWEEANEDESL